MKKSETVVLMRWQRPTVTINPEFRKQIWKIIRDRIWIFLPVLPLYAAMIQGYIREDWLRGFIAWCFLFYAISTVFDSFSALWNDVFEYNINTDGILLIGSRYLSSRNYEWKRVKMYNIHSHPMYPYLREIVVEIKGPEKVLLSFNPSEVNEAELVAIIEARVAANRKASKQKFML